MAKSDTSDTAERLRSVSDDEGVDWVVVQEESPTRVLLDTVGDIFVGVYLGEEHVAPESEGQEPFSLFVFRGRDGELYALNQSYNLRKAMEKVAEGDLVRIQYYKDIPMSSGGRNPLKDFKVSVAANTRN